MKKRKNGIVNKELKLMLKEMDDFFDKKMEEQFGNGEKLKKIGKKHKRNRYPAMTLIYHIINEFMVKK